MAFGVMSMILVISSKEISLLKSAAAVASSNFSRRPFSVMRLWDADAERLMRWRIASRALLVLYAGRF